MPTIRFTDELDLAKEVLLEATVAEHGRTVRDIKRKVQAMSRVQRLVRGQLPGMASDYRRIMGDEAFYRPLLKSRFLLPSGDALVQTHLAALHGLSRFPRLGTAEDIRRALASEHELNAVLIETHLLAIAWAPRFSTKEKIVLGGIEFVKLAAAVYSIVASAGTAVDSIHQAYQSASSGAKSLIDAVNALGECEIGEMVSSASRAGSALSTAMDRTQTAASSAGSAVSSLIGIYGQRQGFAALIDPRDHTGLGTRGHATFSEGSMASGRTREVTGTDLSVIIHGSVADAVRDEDVIQSMSFVAIQQITPVRSNCTGSVHVVRAQRGHIEDIPVALRYDAQLELAPTSLLRVGPVLRDTAAAMAANIRSDNMAAVVFPWDNRGIDGREHPFVEYRRGRSANKFEDLTVSAPPLAGITPMDWESTGWVDSGESMEMTAPYELSPGALATIQRAQSQAEMLFAQVRARREAGMARATSAGMASLQRARARIAQNQSAAAATHAAEVARQQEQERLRRLALRDAALQRHLMSSRNFAEATYRGLLARRDPTLLTVDRLLGEYEGLADDAFVDRAKALATISDLIDLYLRCKPASTKRPVLAQLKTGLVREQQALNQQLAQAAATP